MSTIHGIVLRWSKESILLAGYDQPAMATQLDVDHRAEGVAKQLRAQCPNDPSRVSDEEFTGLFQRPWSCLNLLRRAANQGALQKNDRAVERGLLALANDSLPILRARVPDLGRLAALIWDLHRGSTG